MALEFVKYNGAGNDFFMFDGRSHSGKEIELSHLDESFVQQLCDRKNQWNGADGAIVIKDPVSPEADFSMDYYNSDGSGGMMCGNGGRCIVAFARDLGIVPRSGDAYAFDAPDACVHLGWVLEDGSESKKITITMRDIVSSLSDRDENGMFVDSGTRHLVVFVHDTESVDVVGEGRRLRYLPCYGPAGVNVNFVQALGDGTYNIRTYEKGVEDETLACGTGNVAAAVAVYVLSPDDANHHKTHFELHAKGGDLAVDFKVINGMESDVTSSNHDAPALHHLTATLTGPTQRMFAGRIG